MRYKFLSNCHYYLSRSCCCEGKITVDLYVFQKTFCTRVTFNKTIEKYTSLES